MKVKPYWPSTAIHFTGVPCEARSLYLFVVTGVKKDVNCTNCRRILGLLNPIRRKKEKHGNDNRRSSSRNDSRRTSSLTSNLSNKKRITGISPL